MAETVEARTRRIPADDLPAPAANSDRDATDYEDEWLTDPDSGDSYEQ